MDGNLSSLFKLIIFLLYHTLCIKQNKMVVVVVVVVVVTNHISDQ